jgi:hypothetical protein
MRKQRLVLAPRPARHPDLGHTELRSAAVPMTCADAIGDRLSDRDHAGY